MKRVGSLARFRSTGSLVRRLESLDHSTSSTTLDPDDLAARLRSLAVAASFEKPSVTVRLRRRAVAFVAAIGVFGWVGITGAAASVGLAATGNLPAPIQNTVSNVLDVVGIQVPRSEPEAPKSPQDSPIVDEPPVDASLPDEATDPAIDGVSDSIEASDEVRVAPDRDVPLSDEPLAPFDSVPEAPGRSGTVPVQAKNPPGRSGTTPPQVDDPTDDSGDEFVPPGQDKKDDAPVVSDGPGNSGGAGNSDNSNAGGNSGGAGNSDNSNAGGNSGGAGNSGSSNAGGSSGGAGNSGSSNAGGNSGGAGNSGSSNAGGNSGGAGNSDNSNAGGNGRGNRP